MAITKTIEIDVNSLKAVGGLENLDKALKQVDKSAKSVDATFEEVYGDLQPLTSRMGEAEDRLYELALAGQSATKEYQDLLQTVGNYRKVQMQTDMVVDAAATTFDAKLGGALQGVTSTFAGVQGAMALTGGESQKLEEALLKVQGAMALAEGVRGIREGAVAFKALGVSAQKYTIVQKAVTAGQWLWNTAMAANPIGAIVAAVVALIAAGVALTRFFMSNADAAKQNSAAVEQNRVALEKQSKTLESNSEAFDKKQKQELAMAKASGMSADAIRKLELKLIDEKIAYEKSQRAIAMNTYEKEQNTLASLRAAGADDEVIKKQVENRNEAVKQYNKQNQDVKKSLEEKKDIENRHLVEIQTAQTSSAKENEKRRKEERDKARQELKDKQKKELEVAKAQKDALKAIEQNALKAIEDLKAKTEVEKVALQKQRDLAELDALKLTEEEKAKARFTILEKYKILEAEAKVKDKETKDKEEEEYWNTEAEKAIERQNNLKTQKDKEIEIEKAVADQKLAIQNQNIDSTIAGISVLKGIFEKNKAIQKGLIVAESAVGIAKIIINTQAANARAALELGPYVAPPYIAANNISAGVGIAANIAATVKALSALGGGGAGGASASANGGAAAPAPSFNVVGNSGVNQIAQTLGNQQPMQAYVVANNVTTQQSLDRNIVNNASLG